MASNDVIVFTFSFENGLDPDTYEIHAYKDNGDDATLLWKKSLNSDGGELAFGPGRTVYINPSSGYGHRITAISDGDDGDPEEGGMGFTNNQAPAAISNPNPSDGFTDHSYTSVVLSWDCSDPDGHDLKYDIYCCELIEGEEAAFIPVASQITENSYTLTGLQAETQYLWTVVATDGQAISEGPIWSFVTAIGPLAVEDDKGISNLPESYKLDQNYPNPFNPNTEIKFAIPRRSDVSIAIYNILGRKIKTLVNENLSAGFKSITWDGTNSQGHSVSTGIYFYRIEADDFVESKKMLLLK